MGQIEARKSKNRTLQNEIVEIEKHLADGNKVLSLLKDHASMYDQMRKNAKLEAQLHLARIALERSHKEIQDTQSEMETTHKVINDSSFMLSKAGDRPLSQLTFKRLVKSLCCYGYKGNALNGLTNEIVFEIRFGSLMKCNRTKDALSIDNAVNIALKLVREKRWTTPVLFKKYASNLCQN